MAETGSVLLSEDEFRVNTIGFLAHDIVILLDPADIVENIHDAYGHPHFQDKAYSLLMSGLPALPTSAESRCIQPKG